MKMIEGFSRLSREEKVILLEQVYSVDKNDLEIFRYSHSVQETLDHLSENTITNFPLPYGVVPNVFVNGKLYMVPMVTEESSVVAASASGAKFWASNGGFLGKVIDDVKKGQIYFSTSYSWVELEGIFCSQKKRLLESVQPLTKNMEKRGGGVRKIAILPVKDNFYKIELDIGTKDAMGANFINSVLEKMGQVWQEIDIERIDVLMCILSNYLPECRVQVEAECPIGVIGETLAWRLVKAYDLSCYDIYRAVTHNKGIFNGIDAVLIATGNDFRAVEAGAHAYASQCFQGSGGYGPLSRYEIRNKTFHISLEVPLSLGVVGGITNVHPLSQTSLRLLGMPSAHELMMIAASIGLVQNFSALKALVSTGIQKGHMKLHLRKLSLRDEENGST